MHNLLGFGFWTDIWNNWRNSTCNFKRRSVQAFESDRGFGSLAVSWRLKHVGRHGDERGHSSLHGQHHRSVAFNLKCHALANWNTSLWTRLQSDVNFRKAANSNGVLWRAGGCATATGDGLVTVTGLSEILINFTFAVLAVSTIISPRSNTSGSILSTGVASSGAVVVAPEESRQAQHWQDSTVSAAVHQQYFFQFALAP